MKKIALVSEHASPLAAPGSVDSGGQNVYVAQLARHLAQLGYLVDVYTRCDSPSLRRVVHWEPDIRVIHVPAGPARPIPKEAMLPYMDEFGRFMIGFVQSQGLRYDLLHANFFMSGMVARQVRQALGSPYVITVHALGRVRRQHQGSADGFPAEREMIEESLMQDAARVIAECPQDLEDMALYYRAPTDRIDIVPCGFDPQEFWPAPALARRKLGLHPREFVVLQLGRMVPRKGVDTVIRSIAALRDRHQVHARLLVVGSDAQDNGLASQGGPEVARLKELCDELGVAGQVVFTGQKPRAELRYYYSAASVFVTTPWYEPFGITPLEAMACGVPVIGAAVGGIKDTVVDGKTGYLVPPNDAQAVAQKLALLHAQPAEAKWLGREGLRRVHQRYTWRSVATRIAGVYEAVLAAAPTSLPPSIMASGGTNLTELEWTN
jgi:glycosyltransferase involved in cell wall biosynthesis